MGGTLVEDPENEPTHKRINTALGLSEEREYELYQEFVGKNGDIIDHVEHSRFLKNELRFNPEARIETYAETVQNIIEEREIIEGAENFVKSLQSYGYETVALSSAPPAVNLPFAEELGIEKVYRWKDYQFTEEGDFDRIKVKQEARRGKHEFIEALKSIGVDVSHFGNGSNDIKAVDTADSGLKQWRISNPEQAFENALNEVKTGGY